MTKQEIETIRNIVARLKEKNLGCSHGAGIGKLVEALNTRSFDGKPREGSDRVEAASRIYLDTWIIPSLEMLLPEQRNPDLAVRMSRR